MRRSVAICLAAVGVLAAIPSPEAADTPVPAEAAPMAESRAEIRTARGAVIATPEIAALSCEARRGVLSAIDASGYRGAEPLPEGHPDRALFLYEDALAVAIWRDCTLRAIRASAAGGEVFGVGFAAN